MRIVARPFALKNGTHWYIGVTPDGTFVARASGAAIFASTVTRLEQLVAEKAAGTTTTLPDGFAGWVDAATPREERRQDGFRPFGAQQTRRAAASARQPASPPAADLPRTPGETGATLALCITNAERCLLGITNPGHPDAIGGDLVKYSRSVDTALASHRASVAFWTTSPTRFAGCSERGDLVARVEAFKAALAAAG